MVGPRIQYYIPREERQSLLTTGRRLNSCDQTDAQGEVDSPRSSRFRINLKRMSSCSSSVQVLRMDPSSEVSHTENNVIGMDDSDGIEYIPH